MVSVENFIKVFRVECEQDLLWGLNSDVTPFVGILPHQSVVERTCAPVTTRDRFTKKIGTLLQGHTILVSLLIDNGYNTGKHLGPKLPERIEQKECIQVWGKLIILNRLMR